jgi:hypothetical protein
MQQNIENNLINLKYFQSTISSNLKGIELGGDSIILDFILKKKTSLKFIANFTFSSLIH